MTQSFDTIAEAFSRTAEKYDAFANDHPNQTRMRNKVYSHIQRYVPAGSHILELNAGTGTDAVELARLPYYLFGIARAEINLRAISSHAIHTV